jgi:hypothetical protein
MPELTERIQVLMTPEQARRLRQMADREGQSIGAVVRQAVDALSVYAARQEQLDAVADLAAMDLPVDDWSVMEKEVERWEQDD